MAEEQYFAKDGTLVLLPEETIHFENKAKIDFPNFSAKGTLYLTNHRFAFCGKKSILRGTKQLGVDDVKTLAKGRISLGTIARLSATAVKATKNISSRVSGSDLIRIAFDFKYLQYAEEIGRISKNILLSLSGVPQPIKINIPKKEIETFLFNFRSIKSQIPTEILTTEMMADFQPVETEELSEEDLEEMKKDWEEVKLRYEIEEYTDEEFVEIRQLFLPYLSQIEALDEKSDEIVEIEKDIIPEPTNNKELYIEKIHEMFKNDDITRKEYFIEYNKIFGNKMLSEEEIEELILRIEIGEIKESEAYLSLRES